MEAFKVQHNGKCFNLSHCYRVIKDEEKFKAQYAALKSRGGKQAVEEARFLKVARYADDEGLNEEMKEVGRWGDPMAGYVSEKKKKTTANTGGGDGGSAATISTTATSSQQRKEYLGAAAPNRYGIRPGWRWDGVDRGNGFEKEWFQARGRKSRNENLAYQWQMDE